MDLGLGAFTNSPAGGGPLLRFTATFTIPAPITWLNKDSPVTIERSAELRFAWRGCTFTVPLQVLQNLAPTSNGSLGGILFGTVPAGSGATFKTSGLDNGVVVHATLRLKTVEVK